MGSAAEASWQRILRCNSPETQVQESKRAYRRKLYFSLGLERLKLLRQSREYVKKKKLQSRLWWHMPVIQTLRLRQENYKLEVTLGYRARTYL